MSLLLDRHGDCYGRRSDHNLQHPGRKWWKFHRRPRIHGLRDPRRRSRRWTSRPRKHSTSACLSSKIVTEIATVEDQTTIFNTLDASDGSFIADLGYMDWEIRGADRRRWTSRPRKHSTSACLSSKIVTEIATVEDQTTIFNTLDASDGSFIADLGYMDWEIRGADRYVSIGCQMCHGCIWYHIFVDCDHVLLNCIFFTCVRCFYMCLAWCCFL